MSPRDKRPLRILRRDFVRGAAASAPLLWLGGRAHAEAPDPELCSSGVPLPELLPGVGLRLHDAMSGSAGGAELAFQLELVIADLHAFLRAEAPEAEVAGGVVDWQGHARQARVTRGHVRHFAGCDSARTHKRFEVEFEFADDHGQLITVRGEKLLQEERGFDPATDLSRMTVELLHGGSELARGEVRASTGEVLTRLHAVEVEGTLDRGQIAAARRAYLEYMNRQCAGCYSQLPKLVSHHGFLTPEEWRALSLAVRVMLPLPFPADGPSVDDVIANLERFLFHADPSTFASLRAQLQQLGGVAPLVSGHVQELKRFAHDQLHQRGYSEIKTALDSLHKVAVLGYYAHPRSYQKLGYHPLPTVPLRRTWLPVRDEPSARVFDVAIVGSGVAGSLLAERLTAAGKSVVILESGPYVAEMTIDSDELGWLARLERGSGLQQANASGRYARSARSFPILQGHCVGGGGVINNAVCFQLPVHRLEQWRGVGFPVPPDALRAGYAAAASELFIGPVSDATRRLNPSMDLFEDTFGKPQRPSVSDPPTPGYYECLVNLAPGECLGCGLCNTGCGSERKMNALQVHLPRALERDCELVPDAEVSELLFARKVAGVPARVIGLRVRTRAREGKPARELTVRAREYVVSAGAIHSSRLLLRSRELMARGKLPIGERLCAHLVSPVLGFVDHDVHPRPTLQLTQYYMPPGADDGFVIENLYNPPGQAALVMAGYGETHFKRMQRYKQTLLIGAVVPTLPNGRVELGADDSAVISMPLGDNELGRLRRALATIADAMLRARPEHRPSEVIAGVGGGGYVMRTPEAVAGFSRWLHAFDQVALSTGHPQGGNCMSDDPDISVLDEEFRVRGCSNLRVCDASVFPMTAGVNPQWTIMALAHHCANVMNGRSS